jgi:hypothetical protein
MMFYPAYTNNKKTNLAMRITTELLSFVFCCGNEHLFSGYLKQSVDDLLGETSIQICYTPYNKLQHISLYLQWYPVK